MNDWHRVSAYARGDEQAFESLIRQFFPIVFSAAVRQVGDRQLAEEIAQSVFILFARKAAKLSPAVSLTGWLLRTTQFVARDALKQRRRRMKREQEAVTLAAQHESWEPDWTNAAPWVDEALLALPAHEQVCVVARFFEGRSFKEIGQTHRISEDGAQKRVARGLERMREFLLRRGVKVSTVAIPAILGVNFAQAGEAHLPAVFGSVQAALEAKSVSNSVALANRVGHALARRQIVAVSAPVALALLMIGGGGLLFRDHAPPTPPPNPPFRLTDGRIEALGKAWSQVVQRAARLVTAYPQAPGPGDPRFAEHRREFNWVMTQTQRVSTELVPVLRQGEERALLAEFLTVELSEVLDLRAGQKAAAFALLQDKLSAGASLTDALRSLVQTKVASGATIRSWLSPKQRRRFDRSYGTDCLNLFTYPALVVASAGQ